MKKIALEDSISAIGIPLMSGTKMFEGLTGLIDAEVVKLLGNSEYSISEYFYSEDFGVSGILSEENTLTGCITPLVSNRVVACLSNDVFGNYRRLAAKNNLIYIHPTYGTV